MKYDRRAYGHSTSIIANQAINSKHKHRVYTSDIYVACTILIVSDSNDTGANNRSDQPTFGPI